MFLNLHVHICLGSPYIHEYTHVLMDVHMHNGFDTDRKLHGCMHRQRLRWKTTTCRTCRCRKCTKSALRSPIPAWIVHLSVFFKAESRALKLDIVNIIWLCICVSHGYHQCLPSFMECACALQISGSLCLQRLALALTLPQRHWRYIWRGNIGNIRN